MALINCKECKKEVSKSAKTCPHCGFVLKKKMGCFKWFGIIILVGVVLLVIEVATQKKGKGFSNPDNNLKVEVYRASENYMERNLKSPSTADFPGVLTYKNHVKKVKTGHWKVNSYVDSENGFGAKVRTNFSCEVVGSKGSWTVKNFKTN
ncbi:MAG: hypothetical protein COB15_11465 [Flavobacteriales bacterium]|nr:MAG: hypothetical protein COB15_11465 [Flavobacteriales bacterium]